MKNNFLKSNKNISLSGQRSDNIFWSGAENYRLPVTFKASDLRGQVDLYMTLIMGLAYKYFDARDLEKLFDVNVGFLRRRRYYLLVWYGLENLIYKKEIDKRPRLADLRLAWAEDFLSDQLDLNRRSFALQDYMIAKLYIKRAREICKKAEGSPGSLKSADRAAKILDFDPNADLADVKRAVLELVPEKNKNSAKAGLAMPDFLEKFFNKLSKIRPGQLEISVDPRALALDKDIVPKKLRPVGLMQRLKISESELEEKFGPSILSDQSRENLDLACQVKGHKNKHIWYTTGAWQAEKRPSDYEGKIREKIFAENRKKYRQEAGLYRRIIEDLAGRIGRLFAEASGGEEYLSKSGRLLSRLAWKSQIPGYESVFLRKSQSSAPDFSVDLLLDSSASRFNDRSQISLQAFILGSALDRAGIRSRIISFSSLGDYTIMTRLKDYDEATDENIFRYLPQGWNRDGMALRAWGQLLPNAAGKYLLIWLTDLLPRDLSPLTGPIPRSYEGEPAFKDVEEALMDLRKKRISLAALLTEDQEDKAKKLLPGSFCKITSAKQIAGRAGNFICRELLKL